jgi:hypothetical protein
MSLGLSVDVIDTCLAKERLPCLGNILADIFGPAVHLQSSIGSKLDVVFLRA